MLININFSVILFFVQRRKLRRMMEHRFHLYTLGMVLFLIQKGCVEKIVCVNPFDKLHDRLLKFTGIFLVKPMNCRVNILRKALLRAILKEGRRIA